MILRARQPRRVAVIVDAFSTGKLLAPEFRARGVHAIHVSSSAQTLLRRGGDLRPEHFLLCLHYDSDSDNKEILEELRSGRWEVVAVLPGGETGVTVADRLAGELELRNGNDRRSSGKRRNKLDMNRAAAASGIAVIPTVAAEDPRLLLEECRNAGLGWPVVVKPVDSAGTDHVRKCDDEESTYSAAKSIIGQYNELGAVNSVALAQPFVDSPEFVVDTVSWAGAHRVMDVWHTAKGNHNGAAFVPEHTSSLRADDPRRPKLGEFACRVLDALDIRYGAGHVEVFHRDGEFVLVECAARCHGASFPRFSGEVWGSSQVSELVQCYLKGAVDPGTTARPTPLRIVELISHHRGRLVAYPGAATVRSLPTFWSEALLRPGQLVDVTRDAFSSPGSIALTGASEMEIERDYRVIRMLEQRNEMLRVEPTDWENAKCSGS